MGIVRCWILFKNMLSIFHKRDKHTNDKAYFMLVAVYF